MSFLKKLQNLPLSARKIIFWFIIIISSLGLLIWWFKDATIKLKNFQKQKFMQELNLPSFQEIEESSQTGSEEIKQKIKELEEALEKMDDSKIK